MTLLIDTDILLDVALDREPFALPASALLNRLETDPGTGFVAWHSIANFYYLVHSKRSRGYTLDFLRELTVFIQVSPCSTNAVEIALSLDMPDFEDALQASAALACRAEALVTRNLRHYRRSPVPAICPEKALESLR